MFVSKGNIENLMSWFENSNFKLLCLLVGGHLKSESFFSDIFNNKEAIDIISGKEIAIILFQNGGKDLLSIKGKGEGTFVVFPGIIQSNNDKNAFSFISRITDIPGGDNKLHNDIVKSSNTITNQIIDYFNMSAQDVPAILLIERKKQNNPQIIHTFGQSDVKNFYTFLKELAEVFEQSEVPSEVIDYNFINYKSTEKSLLLAKTNYENNLDKVFHFLEKENVSITEFEKLFTFDNVRKIFQLIGVNHKLEQLDLGKKYNHIFEKLNHNKDFIRACRSAKKSAKDLIVSENLFEKAKHNLTNTTYISKKKLEFELLNKTQIKIESICDSYEKKFKFKNRMEPVKNVFSQFFGIAKKSKELLSITENLDKLINE